MGARSKSLFLLIAVGLWSALPTLAQTTQSGERETRARRRPHSTERERTEPGKEGERREREHGDWERRPGPPWMHELFDLRPEDFGPLKEGEEDELRTYVNDNFPRLARVLRGIESADPNMFEHAMRRLVPKLRQLRRIHAENKTLADLVERYVVNAFTLRKLRWAVMRQDGDREELERSVREAVAESVALELEALELWANTLEQARDERIDENLQRLLRDEPDDDMPPIEEPPEIRELVVAVKELPAGKARVAKKAELREKIATEFDRRLKALRGRIETMREDSARSVDERVERMMTPPPPRREGRRREP